MDAFNLAQKSKQIKERKWRNVRNNYQKNVGGGTTRGTVVMETVYPVREARYYSGRSGEGKTTFALRLAAACSSGVALPGMETTEPFNVIYQTAADGLGDTIKPRLIEAGADAYGYLNGMDFYSIGQGIITAACADRIFIALDTLKATLAEIGIIINDHKIKG